MPILTLTSKEVFSKKICFKAIFFETAEDKWQDYVYTVYAFSFMPKFENVCLWFP
jgi:hypothetical protein